MQNLFSFPRAGLFSRLIVETFLLLLIVLGVSFEAALGFSTAHAAGGTPQFGLQPVVYDPSNPLTKSYFIFDSKPGIVIDSRVRVTNVGSARGSVSLFPVDATTGQTSGAVYLNQNDPRKDVGAWLSLGLSQVTLNPGQSQVVPFQVAIPGAVRPGQHLGGIVAEDLTQQSSSPNPTPNKNTSAIQITVKNLTIIAVQINLPGTPVEQLEGTGVRVGGENGYQQLLLGLSNTGTVMLAPSGTLQVANAQGQVLKTISLKLATFLPQTAIDYPVAISGQALGPGDYQATLTLMYGHGQALHYSSRFAVSQQQIAETFGSTASKTQAPPGFADNGSSGLSLWQIVLVAGGGLALLWVVGNALYTRLVLPRKRSKGPIYRSQFKRPDWR